MKLLFFGFTILILARISESTRTTLHSLLSFLYHLIIIKKILTFLSI